MKDVKHQPVTLSLKELTIFGRESVNSLLAAAVLWTELYSEVAWETLSSWTLLQ